MNKSVLSCCLAAFFFTGAVNAYQADIAVTSSIDPTAGITQSDDTALPKTVAMNYTPGVGLEAYKSNVKIWTNAEYDMNVRLANEPELSDVNGINSIPLSVTLNKVNLSTTDSLYKFSELFPSGKLDTGSSPMPLVIKQKNASQNFIAGNYSGLVSLVITQATTKDGVAPSPNP